MLDTDAALQAICETLASFPGERCPLIECLGLTLTEDIVSDVESPPFDKALMDGYAVQAADVATGRAELQVLEEITAGRTPNCTIRPGTAAQIMTGAPLPAGADAVVRVEETKRDGTVVHIDGRPAQPEMNVLRRGGVLRAGETVLAAGEVLTPSRIGVLAELGWARVPVRRRLRIAVLATGDELVPVDAPLGPGLIRNSNEAMLVAQIQAAGAIPVPLGIARDNREDLAAKIQQGLESDLLVLSGGVSAGKLDLVPSELDAAGVQQVFHQVRMKPGKPVWFGIHSSGRRATSTAVFGLPGNPVSSMVCFELFVKTAIRRLQGNTPAVPRTLTASILKDFRYRSDRPTYHPAALCWSEQGLTVRMLPWQGSSDLRATAEANSMAVLAEGDTTIAAGSTISVMPWEQPFG